MRFFVAFGGFVGFALVAAAGLANGRTSPMVLLEASGACILGALLGRWLGTMFLHNVQAAVLARRMAARAQAKGGADASARAQSANRI